MHRPEDVAPFTRRAAPYLAIAALICVFYSPLLAPQAHLYMGDYQHFFVPVRAYATRELQQGRLPQWADELLGGYPFLSDPRTAVFFPLNLASAALRLPASQAGVDGLTLATVLLIGLGGVFLARSAGLSPIAAVAAAAVIVFNGFTITHLGQTAVVQTMSAGVWALGAMLRAARLQSFGWSVTAGLLFASALLAGHPHAALLFVYTAAATAAIVILVPARSADPPPCRATLICQVALIAAIAAAGALVQILPTSHLLACSRRSIGEVSEAVSMTRSLAPRQLWGLLFPGLYEPLVWLVPVESRFQISYDYGGGAIYAIGLFVPMLALFGWLSNLRSLRVHALFFAVVILLLGALGPGGPIYPLLYSHAAGFNQVRFPMRLMMIAYIGTGMLAGLGIDAVLGSRAGSRGVHRASATAAILTALTLVAGAGVITMAVARAGSLDTAFAELFVKGFHFQQWQTRSDGRFTTCIAHQLAIAAGVAFAGFTWLHFTFRLKQPSRAMAVIAAAIIFVELGVYGFHRNIRIAPRKYDVFEHSMFRALPEGVAGRVLAANTPSQPLRNAALVERIAYAGACQPIVPRALAPFIPPESFTDGEPAREKLLDLWNVSHIVCPNRSFAASISGTRAELPDAGWVRLGPDPAARRSVVWRIDPACHPRRAIIVTTGSAIAGTPCTVRCERERLVLIAGNSPQTSAPQTAHALGCVYDDPASSTPTQLFATAADIPPGTNPTEIELSTTGGLALRVTHLLLTTSSSLAVHTAREALGDQPAASRSSEWSVLQRPQAPGYSWMVPGASAVAFGDDFHEIRQRLDQAHDGLSSQVFVDISQTGGLNIGVFNAEDPPAYRSRILREHRRPEAVSIFCASNQPGWLVLSRMWYRGWRAAIDGEPAALLRANGPMCTIPVPPGVHEVTLTFETPGLRSGAIVSAVTWLAGILYLVVAGRRRT